ncbi:MULTISPECIES: methyl-accepting chemotaxis protein [Sphingomonas]|jgi:methyl-accepting chemotaxis protein|uniref:Chemotaxis protein n=1 Tax=Sphingomonas hankookensis TaxID=563996 RepID=A0ABR5Y9G0_9SPHN|nr:MULTISPECIES: methyl-accepting chemotaxis protein [Sphingomonas]KZE11378.1 chemotaxis protein [Sphingomonas hankookensis]PZT90880.1 MAG: methyl-accepting chemotaxis protein [Sphingomonas sp.]RSV30933.1 methyl-accepting chemotaxis protein [Sphingomonas sp. ABOLH]WCP72061.1 methyl-accepting chemotaxis protein [Sphingomonas hankookensis]
MIAWFSRNAPIRVKFRVLALVYLMLSGGIAALAILAASGSMLVAPGVVVGGALAGVAAIVGVTFGASRLICTPYVTTVVRMEALAAGDLESPVAYTANRDCVGRITKAMATFRESALAAMERDTQRQMVAIMGEGLGKLAAGDLTARIDADLQEPFLSLRDDFNAAVASLRATMLSVSTVAGTIHKGASEISAASDDLSQRTEQQAASLEQSAAAMEQITATMRESAASAARADTIVGTARSEAVESGEVVRRAVDAMGRIERTSAEISDIIAVIDGIAFQTNLLALNAGVEAARAGDAGKGFAVVASEVRALAQRSAEAAKDVKQRITASVETVDSGVALVSETGRSLDRIIARIGEISTLVADISGAAVQQSQGLSQVNTAVAEMDGVTQRNAAMVEQSTAAARSLSSEADALSGEIARFHLGEMVVRDQRDTVQRLPVRSVPRPVPQRMARGNAAVAVVEDDWSEF